jgi:hypothetical protein
MHTVYEDDIVFLLMNNGFFRTFARNNNFWMLLAEQKIRMYRISKLQDKQRQSAQVIKILCILSLNTRSWCQQLCAWMNYCPFSSLLINFKISFFSSIPMRHLKFKNLFVAGRSHRNFLCLCMYIYVIIHCQSIPRLNTLYRWYLYTQWSHVTTDLFPWMKNE